jgi:hypothetical protein
MKKNLLFIFFLLTNIIFSQSYDIKVYNLNYRIIDGVKNNTSSNIRITIYYEGGTSEQIYYRSIGESGDRETNANVFSGIRQKKPISIECFAFVNFRTGTDANRSIYQDIDSYCPSGIFDGHYSPRMTNISYNYVVTPILVVNQNPEDSLPVDDNITLSSQTGYRKDYYRWQYSLDNPPNVFTYWIDLPQFDGFSTVSLSGKSIFGDAADDKHGKNIFFRQRVCGVSSGITKYVIRKSAPFITNTMAMKVSCFDGKDGTVTFTFNRLFSSCSGCKYSNKLVPANEKLNYTLTNTITEEVVKSGSVIMNSDKTFTIIDLDPGMYRINFIGNYNDVQTYTSGVNHTTTFIIRKPNPVAFTTSKTNIWCYGGNDGTITINATEGTTSSEKPYQYSLDGGATWTSFTNGNTTTITNLSLGDYNIKVRDGNGCVAKIQKLVGNVISLGEEIVKTETIEQPKNPVIVNYTLLQQPTFYGGTDGKIVVAITGGTILDNNTYNFEWKNSTGVTQTSTNTSFANGIFNITLNNISSDTYYLSVWDKNYDKATQKEGCGVLNSEQFLDQPKPIVVVLTAKAPSCNGTNAFGNETDFNPTDGQRDESQDGIITATVTGGIPFTGSANGGKPYIYFWKKQLPNGDWQKIDNPNAILLQVSDGNYALNVEDKNGIRLGTYFENGFIEKDSTLYVKQPDKLEISFVKQDVTCGIDSNGSITANVTGGIPPYNYEWSTTGSNTNTLSGLGAGNYFVRVTDAKKCVVQGSIDLPQPEGIDIAHRSKNPSCNQGSNGSINLIIKAGGRPPFTYEWNTGATTQNLKNLTAGSYTVVVKDSIGCAFVYTVTLKDPKDIIVNLGPDRTLCNEQSHDLDITIDDPDAKYSWTSSNGFSANEAKVTLKEAGIYNAKVINSKGCEAEDTIEIKTTKVSIESEFFVTSQAYLDEEVMLVNTSNPFGEKTQWVIPTDALVVSEEDKFTILKFNTAGTKTISLKQTQGDCYALYSKNITVEDRGTFVNTGITSTPFIKDFIITPNPSNGKFATIVNLQDQSPVKLRLYSYVGQTAIIQKSGSGQKNYVIDFDVNLPAGTYVLVLETSQQTLIRKVIIF